MKKTTPQPSEMKMKKEILILTLCATNFYMPFVFFVMFYHTLLLPSTTLKTKTLVNCYVFLSFFFSSFRNFSYVLGKIAGKCWQWKETKSFPFLNSPLPHVSCQLWMMMLNGWNKVLFWHIRKKTDCLISCTQ